MHGSPTAQAAFVILRAFVGCCYVYIIITDAQASVCKYIKITDKEKQGLEPAVRPLKAQEQRFTYSPRPPRYYIVLHVVLHVIQQHVFVVIMPKLCSRTI